MRFPPDRRLTLARDGVAAVALEGVVTAERYVAPTLLQVVRPVAPLRRDPLDGGEQLDQLLFGEHFDRLERVDGWAFGQAQRDGYVGFVREAALQPPGPAPTHWVRALRTFALKAPTIKATPQACYAMNVLVSVEATDGAFSKVAGSGWVSSRHLAALGDWADDPAGVALAYLGAPYLWGGRDSLGLDCSGLVQQALYACGQAAPRDSDLQRALGDALEIGDDLAGLLRNDLVFWRGHVGLMLDPERLLHANAHHMAVAIEPLAEARARILEAGGGAPVAIRRLTPQRSPVPAALAPAPLETEA